MKIFTGIVVVILSVYIYRTFIWTPEIVNFPSEGKNIVAFGDSLVSGVGSQGGGFVTSLALKTKTPIVNLGKSGDSTADGLARVSEIFQYNPKVVILLLGGNDALRRISREETFNNLRSIIREIQGKGSIVLLLGVRGGLLSDAYSSDFKDLSEEMGTVYVSDVLSGIFGNPELMYDEIHPNDKGYEKIAERIVKVLPPLLK